MADSRRTRPPRTGPWETPNVSRDQRDTWVSRIWPIPVTNKISSTLRNALTSPSIVRLLRSDLSEWSEDDGWHCYRLLGAGSFGTAAVWKRIDANDKLLDEVVIKEDRKKGLSRYQKDADVVKRFLEEAEVMQTLNTQSTSGNIVHMRGYKLFLRMPRATQRKQKTPVVHNEFHHFYLEYAPYGTLKNLAVRYKAFNRYLPELFLWHVFNSLARAAVVLEGPQEDDECYVHLDIKPDNIFLGYENAKLQNPTTTGGLNGETIQYPSVKLGDFGVTEKVNKTNNWGIRETEGVGTAYFKAPEAIRPDDDSREGPGQYGGGWDPPLHRPDDNLTTKADVWAIGKVMFDLFSLSVPSYFHREMAKSRPQYEANENKMIPDFDSTPFNLDHLHALSPYSKALSDAIMLCMHAEASQRPRPAALYEATRRCMEICCAQQPATLPFSVRRRKLYYYGNEINNMSFGERNCLRDLTLFDWEDLHAPGNNDPNEPELDVHAAQFWNMGREQEQKERKKQFKDHLSGGVEGDFHDLLLEDKERIRMNQREIEVLDPDVELTYKGRADEAFFFKEAEKRRRRRVPKTKGDRAGGGSHHGSTDDNNDDDNDSDGNYANQGSINRSNAPPPSNSAPEQGTKRRRSRRNKQGPPKPLLGGAVSSQQRVMRFTPYIPIDAHQERFKNTDDSQDLIFVIDTAPDPSLVPKDSPASGTSRVRKRAADFFDLPSEVELSLSNPGEAPKRRRYFTSSDSASGSSKRQSLQGTQKATEGLKTAKQPRRSEQ